MILQERLPALAALALPVLAGALWMSLAGAPAQYPLINLAALGIMAPWVLFGRGPHTAASRTILFAVIVVMMLSALAFGPQVASVTGDSVRRWFAAGPIAINTGLVAIPPLAVLAARHRKIGPFYLLAALGVAFLQPDAAAGFALTFAAVGIHHVTQRWPFGAVAIVGFFASIAMALRGEIAPQPFVERVLVDAASQNIAFAVLLFASLAGSFALMLLALPLSREKRFALAGALFGFAITATMTHYPYPLIGYGASAIIGFGIALGLNRIPAR